MEEWDRVPEGLPPEDQPERLMLKKEADEIVIEKVKGDTYKIIQHFNLN